MKNIKYIYLPLLLILACEDQLQEDSINPNANTPEIFFQTELDAISSINAAYNTLIIDGFYNRMGLVMADARGDELIGRSPWDVLSTVGNFVLPATNGASGFIWEAGYILINRANQTIEGVSEMDIDQNLKNRVLGQAYFLRAYSHYHLILFYSDIPIVTKVPATEEERRPANSPQAQVWEQVIADLQTAIPLLPQNYNNVEGPDAGQNQRITSGAAHSLLGKAYLYTKRWAEAAAEFDAVMASGEYALAVNFADNFTENPAIEQANPESIFTVEFTNDESPDLNWGGVPSATWRQFSAVAPTYGARGFGFYDFFPSPWLYQEMKMEKTISGGTDPRMLATILSYEPDDGYTTAYGLDWFASPVPAYTMDDANGDGVPEDIFIKKFTRADQGVINETASLNSGINHPVIRYADVLLMNAEAKNEMGMTAEAAALVQQVRDRANLPNRQDEFAAMSQEQFREQLAHERVMEFAIEGSRINDIIRWGWFDDPAKVEELKSHDPEFENWVQGKEYLPIPQSELDINANLTGNSAN